MTALQSRPATVPLLTDTTATATARDIATELAEQAAWRDRGRCLPHEQITRLGASGLLALTVPRAYGGPGLGAVTVAEVFRLLATGDPSVAQIPHSHFVYVNALRENGTDAQRQLLFGEVLAGRSFGNAQSETGTANVREHRTTLHPDGPGRWRLTGEKGYCTGALFADWIPVLAHLRPDGPKHVAWVRRDAPGVTVIDDWDGLGQRTTASGTVRLERVAVDDDLVTPYHLTFDHPQVYGAWAQLLHAAIDTGIARAALTEAAAFVATRSRPYPDAGVARAAEDPLVVQAFGRFEVATRAAEALLRVAAERVDAAEADLDDESAAAASLAVAAARAASTTAALDVSNGLFEVAGTRAALRSLNLDRHWRNARTHTLHDPVAWKFQHLGRFAVDGTLPPRHGQL